ncbi:glycosyl hydrolase family 28-related protein [Nocardia sp. CA-120079]|uniref:glycosyl hydrolase family 28-related protein n=1 Tax=Nocardia sp. CA-120079 TaxID=3239974 RepID=UPI003D962970
MATSKAVVTVDVASGDVLCPALSTTDPTAVTKAVRAALLAGTVPVGIAVAAASAGAVVEYYTAGTTVPAATTGLGAGLAGAVIVDETGRCAREKPVSDEDFVLGQCDAAGTLTVRITHTFANVRDFGAGGDQSRDDWPAIDAARRSLTSGTLYFPAGNYRTSRPIYLGNLNGIELRGADKDLADIRFFTGHGPAICMSAPIGGHLPTGDALLTGPGRAGVLDSSEACTLDLRDTAVVDLDGATEFAIECTVAPDTVKGACAVLTSSGKRLPSESKHSAFRLFLIEAPGGFTVSATARIGTEDVTVEHKTPIPLGRPTYLGLVWDGTTLSLYIGDPGATTSRHTAKPKSSANTTLTQAVEEGVYLGIYSGNSWPAFAPFFKSFTGRIDSIRISDRATITGPEFTAPTAKFPTDDATNRGRTRLLINFDRDVDVFTVGYTWYQSNSAMPVYLLYLRDNQAGWCSAQIRDITVQSLGIGIQGQVAAGSLIERVQIFARDGIRLHNFSYLTGLEYLSIGAQRIGIGLDQTGLMNIKRYTSRAAQYEFTATGQVGVVARDWYIGAGTKSIVPILLNGERRSYFHGTGIAITDEDLSRVTPDKHVREASVMTANMGEVTFESSIFEAVKSTGRPCPPVVIDYSAITTNGIISHGNSTFINCGFEPGALAPAHIIFSGATAPFPVRMIGSRTTNPNIPWTQPQHRPRLSFVGGCVSSTDTGFTQWQGTRDWVFAIEAATGTPSAVERERQATITPAPGASVDLATVALPTGTVRCRAEVLATGPNGQAALWILEQAFTGGTGWSDTTRVVSSTGTDGGTVPSGWPVPQIVTAAGNIVVRCTAPSATVVGFTVKLNALEGISA